MQILVAAPVLIHGVSGREPQLFFNKKSNTLRYGLLNTRLRQTFVYVCFRPFQVYANRLMMISSPIPLRDNGGVLPDEERYYEVPFSKSFSATTDKPAFFLTIRTGGTFRLNCWVTVTMPSCNRRLAVSCGGSLTNLVFNHCLKGNSTSGVGGVIVEAVA